MTDNLLGRIGSLRRLLPPLSPRTRKSTNSTGDQCHSAPPISQTFFQMEYTINGSDTLERVAAAHDCTVGELMKLNRMSSRMVFPGQRIMVPMNPSEDVFDPPRSNAAQVHQSPRLSSNDRIRKGPGSAVPAQVRRESLVKTQSAPAPNATADDDVDTDCLRRFLKVPVKQVTESEGTVSGTLLVTPNCLMFDPDVSHPLVRENGPNLYGMVANMDEIVSLTVYKDIGALTGDLNEKRKDIYDPSHVRTPSISPETEDAKEIMIEESEPELIPKNVLFSAGDQELPEDSSPRLGSDSALPAISEELKDSPQDKTVTTRTRAVTISDDNQRSRTSSQNSDERPRSFSELDTPVDSKIGRFSPNAARRSFGKLGRTLSARAKSIQGSAEKVAQTAVQGTKTVAHGVVTHTKSAADSLQNGIETGVKVVGEQAKAAADVAGRVVDKGQNLVNDGINGVQEMFTIPDLETDKNKPSMKRERSLATLETLRQKTAEARQISARDNKANMFSCATGSEEMPDLFLSADELIEKSSEKVQRSTEQLALPYYMAVRLTRDRKRLVRKSSPASFSTSYDEEIKFGNKLKREFWFAVPRSRAENIYHFLLQWSPEKYGQDTAAESVDEAVETAPKDIEKGFIVLDANADESLTGGEKSSPFVGSLLNREWELVTVSEMCRRLSLDQELEMPIPDGAETSQILDELMIRQVMDILPARAEGYPWVNIYSSEKHGFSLSTLYRKMAEFDEDLSPVLLIIRDTNEHVFGAVVSSAIRPSDHFTGTGDSCLLWRFTGVAPHTRELRQYTWTGDNQFFVSAVKDALSIGAGGGHNGLWLDADLNHGRSQRCETFDNEPLCGENEDFIIQYIEAYGFRM